MKNLLTAVLPALALFALGGCAGTSALTSSEVDGVYYSSRDRTTAVVNAPVPSPISANEAANPDYNGNSNNSSARQSRGSDEYYDNTYTYMRGVPNYGVTSYAPYSPYTSINYSSGGYGGYGGYGWGGGAYGFSPYSYGMYDPFYSPFYGYGSGISISFGFGRPYGYGGYGYGRPYGYGYGGGFYDPYYYSSPFYGGYYGRGGYYGNNYYGYNSGYNNGYNNSNGYYGNGRNSTPGHRTDRASDGQYSTNGLSAPAPTNSTPTTSRPRNTADGLLAPGTGTPSLPGVSTREGIRSRGDAMTATPNTPPARAEEPLNRPRRTESADQPRYRNMEQPAAPDRQRADAVPNPSQNEATRDNSRGRSGNTETQPQRDQMRPQPTVEQPVRQEGQRRRGGFFQDVFSQPANKGGGQPANQQPARQRNYDQPQQQQRAFEQPRQRSYEQPQQRSYEQPQRSYSQPSYSSPSNGGGGGGGHRRGE